jgi:hypothetical protein
MDASSGFRSLGSHICCAQSEACRISSSGLHWEALDEDISVIGLLAGFGDQTRPLSTAAE